ncbi:DUF1802 family protein [Trichocoleus desertorum AS-A10]|uniref:DUF1802 family protein n=1 Tax=Trichocoleus desertorum TaxID=1481672 RepID=UPI00329CA3BB
MEAMEPTMTHALKEWAVAVSALVQGQTILLLRKGGIKEQGGTFRVAHDSVVLYPTYEHQKPDLLKPVYAAQVQPVTSGWHPETVPISAWAQITHILQVVEAATVAQLLPYHIWNERFVSDRLKWKPRTPLYLLLLRAYRLPQTQMIPYRLEYGGCQSWIDLATPISLVDSTPVLSDAEYARQTEGIQAMINESIVKTTATSL